MKLPNSVFPKESLFSILNATRQGLLRGALIVATAISFVQTSTSASAAPRLSTSLARQCAQPPKLVISAPSTAPQIVKKRPLRAQSALRAGWAIQGLTRFDRDVHTSIKWEKLRDRTGACLRIHTLKIEIGNEDIQIWLSPSLDRNACLKKVVLAHELRHVRHHKEYVYGLQKKLRYNLKAYLAGRTYKSTYPNASDRLLKNELSRTAKLAVLKLHHPFANTARQRDRAMDTPQAYAKELAKCGL
ncbi:hypothetical protein [Donghicola sp. XS_ASV15]|uniref:hypothetical protein n=1 Tax=Donghicola sp. XS_ASV15 TaxID=3241295 RepID=UPI003514C627